MAMQSNASTAPIGGNIQGSSSYPPQPYQSTQTYQQTQQPYQQSAPQPYQPASYLPTTFPHRGSVTQGPLFQGTSHPRSMPVGVTTTMQQQATQYQPSYVQQQANIIQPTYTQQRSIQPTYVQQDYITQQPISYPQMVPGTRLSPSNFVAQQQGGLSVPQGGQGVWSSSINQQGADLSSPDMNYPSKYQKSTRLRSDIRQRMKKQKAGVCGGFNAACCGCCDKGVGACGCLNCDNCCDRDIMVPNAISKPVLREKKGCC